MREDFSELRQIVTELAQAQRRTEQHIEALVEAQRRTEQRLEHLEVVVETLVEQVRILTQAQQRTVDTVGSLKGRILEWAYRGKAVAYFGRLLRRTRVVAFETIEQTLESRLCLQSWTRETSREPDGGRLCCDRLATGPFRLWPANKRPSEPKLRPVCTRW